MLRPPLATRVGRFRLLDELGRGGMGVVYRAADPASGGEVALKVLLAADHAGDLATRRFQREAETARFVEHPNVVKVHELGWHEGRPFFTMDLVEGGSLEDLRGSMRSPEWYAKMMAGAARGLQAAHERGLAHRDIKPSNILLDGDTPRLTDFGLARELSSVGQRLTATGEVLGTPHYMAPEQAGNQGYEPALGDQYSLGAVLYDLLAGRPPHDGDNPVAVMMSLASADPPPLASVAPDAPPALVRIVEQAMARAPNRRYRDCAALAEDLDRFAQGEPVEARSARWRNRADRALFGARRPLALATIALTVVLLALGTAATWRSVDRQRANTERELLAQGDLRLVDQDIQRAVEAGEAAQALSALEAFAARHRGTRTAIDTVLREVPPLMPDAPSRALSLLAEAYTDAPDSSDQDRVLAALAGELEARWDWSGLAAVTATQARRHPLRTESRAMALPRGRVQFALGNTAQAAGVFGDLDPSAAAVARALTPRSQGPEGVWTQRPVDWDGDGLEAIGARVHDELVLHRLAPGLPEVARYAIPAATQHLHLLGGRRWIDWDGEVMHYVEATAKGPVVRARRTSSAPLDAVSIDLDGDGHDEVYVGLGPYDRRLVVLDTAHLDAGFRDAHEPTTNARSDVAALLPLPDATPPQLWASVGPWTAYDVRRYAFVTGALHLLERERLGYVPRLVRVDGDRIAALHSAEYPSQVALDPEEPYGPPPGIYTLAPDATEVLDVLRWSGPDAQLVDLQEADVDGDGRADWIISAERAAGSALAIYLGSGEGHRDPLVMGGFQVLAHAQLDDDPPEELLVRDDDGATWMLGIGAPSPPRPLPEVVPPQPPPDGLDPAASAAWQRAEDLVAMGLYVPAAAAFSRLYERLPEALAPQALARAARLHETSGHPEAAAEAWTRLVGRVPDARDGAIRQLRAAHRFAEAQAVGGPAPPRGDTRWDLVDGARRAEALTVFDPVGAEPSSDGLDITAVSGEGPIAGVRLPWTGEHLAIEAEVSLRHLEWGSGLVLGFEGWEEGQLALRAWGGGGLYHRTVECPGTAKISLPSDGVPLDETWTIRLDWYDGELLCEIRSPDGVTTTRTTRTDAPPSGDLDVTLRPAAHAPASHALARGTVHRWSVLATQELPRLSARPDVPVEPTTAHGLRTRPAAAVASLLDELGPEAILPFRAAHAALHHSHPNALVTQRIHTLHAAPLLASDPAKLTDEGRMAYAEVLAHRGMAWLDAGDRASARTDLAAAEELLEAMPPPAPGSPGALLRVDVCLALATAWIDRAPETARTHLRRALQLHPVPELASDRLLAFPELQALADR